MNWYSRALSIKNCIAAMCGAAALVCVHIAVCKADTVVRGPYLQQGSPYSMIVRWRTDVKAETRLEYSTSLQALTTTSSASVRSANSGPSIDHEVLLSGLMPQTRYYYRVFAKDRVIAGGDAEHFFVTSPSGGDEPVRAWIIGDAGVSGRGVSGEDPKQRAVRDAFLTNHPPGSFQLLMMLGDNAYQTGTDDEYQRGVFEPYRNALRSAVTWPTQGNHDYSNQAYYPVFSLPTHGESGGIASDTEQYYSFDYGNVHFISLNSEIRDDPFRASMVRWLRQDIQAHKKDWVVAFWHHPPYTKGQHDSDKDSTSEGRLLWMRSMILPILESGGVDLVLSGHSHSYERSKFIAGHYGFSTTLSKQDVINGGDGHDGQGRAYTKPALHPVPNSGAVFVVAGSSVELLPSPLNHPAMAVAIHKLGSVYLEVDANELNVRMIGADGAIEDYFTIRKEPNRPRVLRDVTATVDDKCRVRLQWAMDAKDSAYSVYRSSNSDQRGEEIGTVPSGSNSFKDTLHKDGRGRDYFYSVRASNAAGKGPWGAAIRVAIPLRASCK